MSDFEKLGSFYLGKTYDVGAGEPTDELLLYDSKDLTTHAICVGMTGSGKTGLCVSLLEEAAIDGVPTIAIDPKGDLGNLMLTFPELRPGDFRPWVDDAEAARNGMTADEYAADRAKLWKWGLGQWGEDGERIARLRESAEVSIYTPGGSAGLPISVLRSLRAPESAVADDADAVRERVSATVAGLLALVGIEADPTQSREHILLTSIVDRAWRRGEDLDIAGLIMQTQSPPFDRLGVMDVESFFPAKDRNKLAMSLNSLLASPQFEGWRHGEPLDIGKLLHSAEGKPRVSVLSIAHLSDAERMFFVTILLGEIISWMRRQPGTGSLRAILYMDEIFGFFPPVANPPSKTPMLTLLKQARAYGLGVVLATQNPADLDYKGLSNTGTWFIGRLQTERDKRRLLDGLETAGAGGMDRPELEKMISGLDSRVFLMNNVHDDGPTLFHTRWAMSYLRGPLTSAQISSLMNDKRQQLAQATAKAEKATGSKTGGGARRKGAGKGSATPPPLPAGMKHQYLYANAQTRVGYSLVYQPALLGCAVIHHVRTSVGVDEWKHVTLLARLGGSVANPWAEADALGAEPGVALSPVEDAQYGKLPAEASRKTTHTRWERMLKSHLYRTHEVTVLKCKELKAQSAPNESEDEFRAQLRHLAREKRDLQIEKIKKKYAPKMRTLVERVRRSEQRVEREKEQAKQQGFQTAISFGATLLGAILGRKKVSTGTVGRAATAARGVGRTARERGDIARAEETEEALRAQLEALEREFQDELGRVRDGDGVNDVEIERIVVRPRKADTTISRADLVWAPYVVDPTGIARPASPGLE